MSKKCVINANNFNSFFPKRTFWAIRSEFGRKYIKKILKIGKFYFRFTTSQILFVRAKYVSKKHYQISAQPGIFIASNEILLNASMHLF